MNQWRRVYRLEIWQRSL